MPMIPISFEFYPPKTDEQRELLDRTAKRLKPHAPEYVSCTFGAGGSTLSYTSETVRHLRHVHGYEAAPHVSCMGGSREEIRVAAAARPSPNEHIACARLGELHLLHDER